MFRHDEVLETTPTGKAYNNRRAISVASSLPVLQLIHVVPG